MGNNPSKKGGNLPRTNPTGNTALARFPSLSTNPTVSNIPEEVIAAHESEPSEPILIRPLSATDETPTSSGETASSPNATETNSSDTKSSGKERGGGVANIATAQTRSTNSSNGTLGSPIPFDNDLDLKRSSTVDVLNGMAGGLSMSPDKINIDDMIHRLLEAGYSGKISKSAPLKNAEIMAICQVAREILLSQPSLIELSAPVKIVGDIHGQFHDLLRLFEMCGYPPSANFLFLGDYVDRGKQSLETILLLLCYKIKHPENFFILRGNHECANVTRVYGFYDECKRRCNVKILKTFISVFNCLPIAAVVAGKIFCVHGGLSPHMRSLDDVRALERPCEVPDYGLLNDLLWSDPSETAIEWEDNERGVSYCFGKRVVTDFLQQYDLDLVCRAHMVVEDGYEFFGDRQLVTIFSAPNYCGEFDNYGGVMGVSDELLCSFELLKPVDEPFRNRKSGTPTPNHMNESKSDIDTKDTTTTPDTNGVNTRRASPPLISGPQSP